MAAWRESLRGIEDMGFSAIVMADHFTEGYELEPMVGLTAAATYTSAVRLQTGVLGNDYRHPVLVHRMAAALDSVSEGRLVLGLGAGWMTSDYEAAGLDYDPPGQRLSRFEEAVAVIKGLFREEPLTVRRPLLPDQRAGGPATAGAATPPARSSSAGAAPASCGSRAVRPTSWASMPASGPARWDGRRSLTSPRTGRRRRSVGSGKGRQPRAGRSGTSSSR